MKRRRKDNVISFLESELREYRTAKIRVRQLKQEKQAMYHKSRPPSRELVRGSHPGDPTSAAAIRIINIDKNIREYETQIAKIEAGLEMCNLRERELIKNKYFTSYEPTHEQNMECLRYGNRNTYYNTRDEAFRKIARAYGIRGWDES
jgi:hypothetical protein